MARVADVHADMRDFRGRIERHLRLSFLTPPRAVNSPEGPFVRAKHANQRLFCAISFGPQYADDGPAAAQRAGRWRPIHNLDFAMVRKAFGGGRNKNP